MEEWEFTLRKIFDEIDDYLEDTYGHIYPLHPVRPRRGETSNKSYDGLFNVGASFTAGFGSEYGRGWVFDVHISTLSHIDNKTRGKIYKDAISILRRLLKNYYPDWDIKVKKDRHVFKIYGDIKISYKNS